ncbi:hypothetical protein EB093_05460 [bacterium]|nr:hypothetical protein [bacterium]
MSYTMLQPLASGPSSVSGTPSRSRPDSAGRSTTAVDRLSAVSPVQHTAQLQQVATQFTQEFAKSMANKRSYLV